jgi:hypothetical protein
MRRISVVMTFALSTAYTRLAARAADDETVTIKDHTYTVDVIPAARIADRGRS